MADSKFPGPYVNSTKADDPMMKRVPMDKMDIGARSSGLPSGGQVKSESMSLKHVEDQNRK